MATYDYLPLQKTARALLEKFGQVVTLEKAGEGSTYDPVTGEHTGATKLTATAFAALFDYSLQNSGAQFADGTNVRIGDKDCLIEASDFVIDESTTLTDSEGVTWQLEKVRKVAPAGAPVVIWQANGKR